MKKRILLPTLLIGALLTGSLALAGPGGCGGQGMGGYGSDHCAGGRCNDGGQGTVGIERHAERMGKRLEMIGTVLDLSEAQTQQLETQIKQQWQDNQQLREQIQTSRKALREAQSADSFNEADFRVKAAKQAELKTEMLVAKAKLKQQLYALLTPEQQEKADKLGGMMGKHGNGRHGGKGFGF